jgi:hypothetical protein
MKQTAPTKFRARTELLYHYWGIVFGRLTTRVKVISQTVVEGHAAVWAGVNAGDNVSWVQGGIAMFPPQGEGAGKPEAYIERHQYGNNPVYTSWPIPVGQVVLVKLVRTSYKHWKVIISWPGATHESEPVVIPRGKTIDACLEIWGHATAEVKINKQTVKGSAQN